MSPSPLILLPLTSHEYPPNLHDTNTSTENWIGVDLDGTLAYYDGWKGIEHIGAPIPLMVLRVQQWLAEGKTVKIFTARVGPRRADVGEDPALILKTIEDWCLKHIGQVLPVTATKDFAMVELWDDRCIQVIPNTGTPLQPRNLQDQLLLMNLGTARNPFTPPDPSASAAGPSPLALPPSSPP